MRILLVEDERDMAEALNAALSRHHIVMDHAPTLEIAEEACRSGVHDAVLLDRHLAACDRAARHHARRCGRHDAVLLDRKLPDGEGLTLIPVLRRENPGLPVIVLSALNALDQRVEGLDTGADDYLAKPFSTEELLARLRAVMRRPSQMGENAVYLGTLRFDLHDRQAEVDGTPLELTRSELLALEILIRRSGRTVSRTALADAVYGFDDDIASNTLDAHISRLRRKLSCAGIEIHGIRGLGYLMRAAQ